MEKRIPLLGRLLKLSLFKKGGLGESDAGILKTAMLVSALDGQMLPSEFAMFRKLAANCANASPEETEKILDEGLHSAGYLLVKRDFLSGKAFAAEFVAEALKVLPKKFVLKDDTVVRRAFINWVSMAMCDGDYSGIERQCLEALHAQFRKILETQFRIDGEHMREHSPIPVMDEELRACVRKQVEIFLPTDFLTRAVTVLQRFDREGGSVEAKAAIEDLII